MASLYILQSTTSGKFYIGSANDVEQRFAGHQRGQSAYTRPRGPWTLVYQEQYATLSEAQRRERQLKSFIARIRRLQWTDGQDYCASGSPPWVFLVRWKILGLTTGIQRRVLQKLVYAFAHLIDPIVHVCGYMLQYSHFSGRQRRLRLCS